MSGNDLNPARRAAAVLEDGLTRLSDQWRRSYRYSNQLPPQLEAMIVARTNGRPHWGAHKLRELRRWLPNDVKPPAASTLHAVRNHNSLVSHQDRPCRRVPGPPLSAGARA